ncbi:Asp/Glu/hydantoin racemase [Histidinibacterium aquaticum]|uniref:Asp/Glu/hydantoin racemase n=2 Tax=Histidinibacterium aquaticum TaxID=2613962 RepID=A0A5J5GJD9_9RHOB|nr:Asp/Glu/hydantoin racemase [Histidinibacterium aquaticum]
MLTPSSNTVLEPATNTLIAPLASQASVHFGRFRVTRIAMDDASDEQFADDAILTAADLLADACPSIIAWNGTAASWRGFETDTRLCEMIEARTGCPATSAIMGLNEALSLFAVRRLGLVTPYTGDVQEAMIANYATLGIEVAAARRADLSDNYSFATVEAGTVQEMCREVASDGVDAVAVVCTNMRGPLIARAVEDEFDVPVIDSIAVTLWTALRRLGVDTRPLARFGRLFEAGAA